MNNISKFLIDAGVRALIGKGGMGSAVQEQLKGKGGTSLLLVGVLHLPLPT
jgi:tartrate dehydratase beta subunit/fumarate hydratase class I family protein